MGDLTKKATRVLGLAREVANTACCIREIITVMKDLKMGEKVNKVREMIQVGPIWPLHPDRKPVRTYDLFPRASEIKKLAYVKWQQAGSPEGDGVKYWLEAEKELRNVTCKNEIKL